MFWRALLFVAVGMTVAIAVLRVAGVEGIASTLALSGVAFLLAVSLRWVLPRRTA